MPDNDQAVIDRVAFKLQVEGEALIRVGSRRTLAKARKLAAAAADLIGVEITTSKTDLGAIAVTVKE